MTTFSKKISQSWLLVMMIITTLTFTSCKKDENVPPPPVWHNTFTPPLENNNQRDSVYDDEDITFSTNNPASGIYIWSWGDGSKNDTTETIYAIHRFQSLGLNIVKLRVERGNTYGENTDSIWVFHRDIPPCGFRIDGQDSLYIQHASQFVANINTPNCNSTCSFDYQWDFGDGNSGTGYSVSHSYEVKGTYLLKVKISRCNDSDINLQKTIVVSEGLETYAYKCSCQPVSGGFVAIDTIEVQNLPSNPILADGRVLRRTAAPNRYYGEYDCNTYRCDTYTLDVFENLDSIDYSVVVSAYSYVCRGRRL